MNVTSVSWSTYLLPFRRPYLTSRGAAQHRPGLILELHTDAGIAGLGEAAPAPDLGWSADSLSDAMREATRDLDGVGMRHLLDSVCRPGGPPAIASAVRCALDTAASDALAREAGLPLARFLAGSSPPATVRVNALVNTQDLEETLQACRRARDEGFGAVKLKVGVLPDPASERGRVAAARDALGPDIALRLDANGAWTPDEAIETLQALAAYDIEYVEQPIAPGQMDALGRVRDASPVAIAADEELTSVETALEVIRAGAADVLVIKPQCLGGLSASRRVIEAATAAGLRCTVTTNIETGIGTAACLHLAATLPPGSPACGLATASLLAVDVAEPTIPVERGAMRLPDGPGLGVRYLPRETAHG